MAVNWKDYGVNQIGRIHNVLTREIYKLGQPYEFHRKLWESDGYNGNILVGEETFTQWGLIGNLKTNQTNPITEGGIGFELTHYMIVLWQPDLHFIVEDYILTDTKQYIVKEVMNIADQNLYYYLYLKGDTIERPKLNGNV